MRARTEFEKMAIDGTLPVGTATVTILGYVQANTGSNRDTMNPFSTLLCGKLVNASMGLHAGDIVRISMASHPRRMNFIIKDIETGYTDATGTMPPVGIGEDVTFLFCELGADSVVSAGEIASFEESLTSSFAAHDAFIDEIILQIPSEPSQAPVQVI